MHLTYHGRPILLPTTAFVVGAGAVENAWAPVIRAIQTYYKFPLTDDCANSFLARLIYLLRWYASVDSEFGESELQKCKDNLSEIRIAICNELKRAQESNEIHVRREFESVISSMLVSHSSRFILVTTNWDCVVETALSAYLNRFGNCNVIPLHIHGSIQNPNTLYLPSEITKEPYRSQVETDSIGVLHGSIWRGIEKAERVVIYGLSLSPLDAELLQTLGAGFSNPNLKEICIVSPDHAVVANRASLLLDPRYPVRVTGYKPDELRTPHDYTLKS